MATDVSDGPNWTERPKYIYEKATTGVPPNEFLELNVLNLFIKDLQEARQYGGPKIAYRVEYSVPVVFRGEPNQEDHWSTITVEALLIWLKSLRLGIHQVPFNAPP